MPGSPSKAPKRTTITSPLSGSDAKRAEPQSPQKSFARPPSGSQRRTRSRPLTTRSDPGAGRAEAAAAVPERCWQRVQWQ